MDFTKEYRPLFKNSQAAIERGKNAVKHIVLPNAFAFSDAILIKVGLGEMSVSQCEHMANEAHQHYNK